MQKNIDGMWWIPGHRKLKAAGRLEFNTAEGLQLQFVDKMRLPADTEITPENLSVILGESSSGQQITLFRNNPLQLNTDFKTKSHRTLLLSVDCGYALLDAHFTDAKSILFDEAIIEYTQMLHWLNHRSIDRPIKKENVLETIEFPMMEPIETVIDGNKISIHYTIGTSYKRHSKTTITPHAYFRIILEQPINLDKWQQDYIRPLQNFMTFVTGQPSQIMRLELCTEKLKVKLKSVSIKRRIEAVRIGILNDTEQETNIYPIPFFTLPTVISRFENILQNWFKISRDLDSVILLYFGSQYSKSLYVETKFISFVQALESYHRRRPLIFKGKQIPDDEFQERINELVKHADNKLKKWARGKLKYSNEVGLPDRLIDLLNYTGNSIPLPPPDFPAFARIVTDTRNYYTHYDPSKSVVAADINTMQALTYTLGQMIEICLLRELGFSDQESHDLMLVDPRKKRNQKYIKMI